MLRQIEADLDDDNEPSEGPGRCLSLAEQAIPGVEFRPFRAGIFKAFGVYRPMVKKQAARGGSFPALQAIGSMSPTRLSLSVVASLQSPLLFGLVPTF